MSEVTPTLLPQHDDTLELNTEVTASPPLLSDSGSIIDTKAGIFAGQAAAKEEVGETLEKVAEHCRRPARE